MCIYIYIYIYIYGENVDIFGRSDKMMKYRRNSGCTKNTNNRFSSEYLGLTYFNRKKVLVVNKNEIF